MPANYVNGLEVPPLFNATPSELDVVQAIRAAHAAGDEWSKRAPASRAALVRAFADRIEAAADRLAALEAESSGTAIEVIRADLARTLIEMRAAIDMAAEANRPVGVVGVIGARARG